MRKLTAKTKARIDLTGIAGSAFLLYLLQLAATVGMTFAAYSIRRITRDAGTPAVGAAAECALLLLSAWIVCAIRQGTLAWHIRVSHGRTPGLLPVLYWLRHARALRAAALRGIMALRNAAVTLLLCLPAAVLGFGAWRLRLSGGITQTCFIASALGAALSALAAFVFAAVLSQRTCLAPYLVTKDPHMPIRSALRLSGSCMDGRCFGMFCFKLSFLPWFAACFAVLPIVYTLPYYRQSVVVRMERICKETAFSASFCAQTQPECRPARKRPQTQ